MLIHYLKICIKYLPGILFWLLLLSVLRIYCIWNGPPIIDGLWTRQINDHLTANLIGSVAYQTSGLNCDDKYIYLANYYPNGIDKQSEIRSLTSLIDPDTWQQITSDTITTTYADRYHRYILYSTSDGVSMKVFEK